MQHFDNAKFLGDLTIWPHFAFTLLIRKKIYNQPLIHFFEPTVQTREFSISEMAWLCHIPTKFQVHLTFSFLYGCNNRGHMRTNYFPAIPEVSKKKTISPVLNGQYQAGWNTKQNLGKNMWLFYITSQILQVSLRDTATSPFITWCFTSAKNLIHHYQKKDFWHEYPFFNGFPPTPHSPPR